MQAERYHGRAVTVGVLRRYVPSLALFGALLLIWQVVPPLLRIREYLLPGPIAVVRAALNFSIPWHAHIWITDRKSTRLNSSHLVISYAVFCLQKTHSHCSV